jgi:Uma2 family endonuclease
MSEPYEEIIEGETFLRFPPGPRHEMVCGRLHAAIAARVELLPSIRLLPIRSVVQLSPGTILKPDITLVTAANNRIWLAAEVVDSEDHRVDTVTKKGAYENTHLPRLWMVDPRYNNVEVYHAGAYGLALKGILAGRELLREELLPHFQMTMHQLFGPPGS